MVIKIAIQKYQICSTNSKVYRATHFDTAKHIFTTYYIDINEIRFKVRSLSKSNNVFQNSNNGKDTYTVRIYTFYRIAVRVCFPTIRIKPLFEFSLCLLVSPSHPLSVSHSLSFMFSVSLREFASGHIFSSQYVVQIIPIKCEKTYITQYFLHKTY